jgi:hypothetical protein
MNTLTWIYLINAVILINHEIDSAYWQEWKLIKAEDKNGINGFLILHFPMLFVILLGLILLYNEKMSGNIISLFLAAGGLFAFFFHMHHLRRGRKEFNTPISRSMIYATLIVSVAQIFITIRQMI